MDTPFDITITLTKKEASTAIAQYVAQKLGSSFSVKADSVTFEVGLNYEDRPGGSSSPVFKQITVKADKAFGGGEPR